MTDITIPESTLRDVVAAQLATRFSDPEIVQSFVNTILETRVDNYGRVANHPNNPTMIRWAIEQVVREFVQQTARGWLEEHHDEFVVAIGEELTTSNVLGRLAQEATAKMRLS